MTAPTNTFTTASAIGNREDLADVIYRITPTATPVLTRAAKTTGSNTLHEWQTQDLATPASNAQAEGDDATAKVVTPTVRLNNRMQISTKTVIVSGTQNAMNPAGRKNELAYQLTMAGLELRNDMELGLTQNNVTATSPRQSRGLVGWAGDNADAGSGYVAPNYVTNVAQTDGTQRAFTETLLKNALQKVYTAGGEPDTVMVSPAAKQTFSTFTGNSTRFDKGEDAKLYAAIDFYVSDFGTLEVIPNRRQRTRDVFILQSDKIAIAYLRNIQQTEIAKTGDSEKRMLVVEYCMEMRAPKAQGAALDIL